MRVLILTLSLCISVSLSAQTLSTSITYQGELEFEGAPAQGVFDFELLVFDAESAGALEATLVVEDVLVQAGLFAVELDFGTGVFIGDDRWLELSVREGASTGGFTGLLPRQALRAAPFALHAQAVAEDSVTGDQIADGTLGAADLGVDSVGASEIIDSEVQARVSGICPAGQVMTSVGIDGEVACVGLPDGDITGVIAGSGLEGGCFDGDCTLSVNTAQIQARITGACTANQAIRVINSSGAVACVNVPSGDITGINTAANSGLEGGCTVGTCNLAVDPTDFMGTNPVDSASTLNPVTTSLGSAAWTTIETLTVTSGSGPGQVLAMANARVECVDCIPPTSQVNCLMGFTNAPSGVPLGVTNAIVGFDSNSVLRDNTVTVDEFAQGPNATRVYYLRGRSTNPALRCQFDDITAGGIFIPD
ncbi:MAG: hypothetical protein AAGJ52_02920 [Pseudomonadota bacterium]